MESLIHTGHYAYPCILLEQGSTLARGQPTVGLYQEGSPSTKAAHGSANGQCATILKAAAVRRVALPYTIHQRCSPFIQDQKSLHKPSSPPPKGYFRRACLKSVHFLRMRLIGQVRRQKVKSQLADSIRMSKLVKRNDTERWKPKESPGKPSHDLSSLIGAR